MEKKDLWTRKTSVQLNINEDWVYNVIMFQFKYAAEKTKEKEGEIEISGFGQLMVSKPKLKAKILKYSNYAEKYKKKIANTTDPNKIQTYQTKLEHTQLILDNLLEKQEYAKKDLEK